MKITITSEISKQFLLEEDAVEGFRTAVGNGQVRLALQILTEVIDGLMDIINYALVEDEDNLIDSLKSEADAIAAEPVPEAKKELYPEPTEEYERAKKTSVNKSVAKEKAVEKEATEQA